MKAKTASGWETEWKKRVPALVVSSGFLIGSHTVPSEEVDRTFAMPIGKLRKRAGIETIAYASDGENELTLGASSLEDALRCAGARLDYRHQRNASRLSGTCRATAFSIGGARELWRAGCWRSVPRVAQCACGRAIPDWLRCGEDGCRGHCRHA